MTPENRPGPKRKRSYSNHPFSRAMLVSGRVMVFKFEGTHYSTGTTELSSKMVSFKISFQLLANLFELTSVAYFFCYKEKPSTKCNTVFFPVMARLSIINCRPPQKKHTHTQTKSVFGLRRFPEHSLTSISGAEI